MRRSFKSSFCVSASSSSHGYAMIHNVVPTHRRHLRVEKDVRRCYGRSMLRVGLVTDFTPSELGPTILEVFEVNWAANRKVPVGARMWVEPDLAKGTGHANEAAKRYLSIVSTKAQLQLVRNQLPYDTPEAVDIGRSGIWIEADPQYCLNSLVTGSQT